MKLRGRSAGGRMPRDLARLRAQLSQAEETLRAIESGQVDALVVSGKKGPRVYTLEGADHAYRVLIESMSEGALTVTAGGVILYANQCFAKMVKRPLDQVLGYSIHRFLPASDRAALKAIMKRTARSGSKLRVMLRTDEGAQIPAQVSIRPLPKHASRGAMFGMVVTDMADARRKEDTLRGISHRLAQAQETERGRVAMELTDNITQDLVVILLRLQALLDGVAPNASPSRGDVAKVSDLLSETAGQVARISRDLRPSVLVNLGLEAALRSANEGFVKRTGVPVKLECARLNPQPPIETKLALYRIYEEALKNVETHARAHRVTVRLTKRGAFVQLSIKDDGIGFRPGKAPTNGNTQAGLGMLRMRERAEFLGGALTIKTAPRAGTEVVARIPL